MNFRPDLLLGLLTALPPGKREWRLGAEGLASGWAFFLFLLLGAASVWAYRRFAPGVPRRLRLALTILRVTLTAVFLVLLSKPVIHLTINEPVRQNLIVLVDCSRSMALTDRRDRPDDLKRAALATGALDPARGLAQELPAAAGTPGPRSRWTVVSDLLTNARLNLLPRLSRRFDLTFYRFGRHAADAGNLQPEGNAPEVPLADAARTLAPWRPDQPATALGEAMRDVLRATHGQPTAGILAVTDGGSNSGFPPAEAAGLVRDARLPLFLYGVGVTSPPDLIMSEVAAPKLAYVNEAVEVSATLRSQGFTGRSVSVLLKANGVEVDAQKVDLTADGEHTVRFRFVPREIGEQSLEASTPVLPEEISKDNNAATAKLRVVDNKVHVLLIEQQPRWDFRYLLNFLQGDRRLEVHAVVIDGEPNLDQTPGSPFLPGLPEGKEAIFNSEVLILGDVNPASLGNTRMQLIRDWVENAGGGLIFLAGPNFDPGAYAGTPLEALLPVVPLVSASSDRYAAHSPEPVRLQLTPQGETSPYLQLAPLPADNLPIWEGFPGVHWTARVARAKPGARVLLVDPRPGQSEDGALPVIALQEDGSGTCVYIGTDETYRWRSGVGQKYYAAFWGQIMESLALQRLQDASSLIRLRTDRPQYFVGQKAVIAGKVYEQGYRPLTVPTLQGAVTVHTADGTGKGHDETSPVTLAAVPEDPGGYRGEVALRTAGDYQFATLQDPNAVLKFQAIEPDLEGTQTAMDESLLKSIAETAHGHFLREEDMDRLPEMLAATAATTAVYRTVELYHSPWWAAALVVLASAEWFLRRQQQLK